MGTRCSGLFAVMVAFSLCACSGPSAPPVKVTPPPTAIPEPAAGAPAETIPPAESNAPESPAPIADASAPAEVGVVVDEPALAFSVDPFVGDYATDDYARRCEGYDWVSVTVEKMHDQAAYIKVRARGDKKRPTCSFDGVGMVKSATVLEAEFGGRPLLFTVEGDVLTVSVTVEEDKGILHYFCSGGATLEGPYTRLKEALDTSAIAPEAFSKELSLQNVTFTITANDALPQATLVVRPAGLEIDNSFVVQQAEGQVTGAEIEDLNSDGWPELMVYSRSIEGSNPGSVVAFSVNNGKSMSSVAFPPLEGGALVGYRGGDEFSVVETSLARRFRIYKEGDADGAPTGPMRQLQYKLVEGEASRIFKLVDVTEIPL